MTITQLLTWILQAFDEHNFSYDESTEKHSLCLKQAILKTEPKNESTGYSVNSGERDLAIILAHTCNHGEICTLTDDCYEGDMVKIDRVNTLDLNLLTTRETEDLNLRIARETENLNFLISREIRHIPNSIYSVQMPPTPISSSWQVQMPPTPTPISSSWQEMRTITSFDTESVARINIELNELEHRVRSIEAELIHDTEQIPEPDVFHH